jgi:hypothetical protein
LKNLILFLSNNSSYQTFQSKTYTEEEWKAFEQEQWEKYQAKRDKKCLDQNRMNLENIKNSDEKYYHNPISFTFIINFL